MKIEKSKSNKPCIICGGSLLAETVVHFITLYGYNSSAYVGIHVGCYPKLIGEVSELIAKMPKRYGLNSEQIILDATKICNRPLNDKIVGKLRVRQ